MATDHPRRGRAGENSRRWAAWRSQRSLRRQCVDTRKEAWMSKMIPMDGNRETLSLAMVEPDLKTRKLFADWVRGTAGVRCAGVYDGGGNTLADLQAHKPLVVIVAARLPDQHFIRRLKSTLPQTQVYIYTDNIDPGHIFQALADGVSGYFLKRIPLVKILAAIRRDYSGNLPSREGAAMRVLEFFERGVAEPEPALFSRRQQEVLDLLVEGFNSKEISQALPVSIRTVDTHVRRIFQKLGVHSRAQAVAWCFHSRDAKVAGSRLPNIPEASAASSNGKLLANGHNHKALM